MTTIERFIDRLKAVRGVLDGSADKHWNWCKARIKTLEDQLAEARADGEMWRKSRDRERGRGDELLRYLQAEREVCANTHARLVRAAKRIVKDRRAALEAERQHERYVRHVFDRLAQMDDGPS